MILTKIDERIDDKVTLNGPSLYVFLTKGIVVCNGRELNRNHGRRDWRNKASAVFGEGPILPERVAELVVELNHGYNGRLRDQELIVDLLKSLRVETETVEAYYNHCRSVQRDLSALSETDLDYLDLFCDSRRSKLYCTEILGEVTFFFTMACAADCLRLHPELMDRTWNVVNAARDSVSIWEACHRDVELFAEMLRRDSEVLIFSISFVIGISRKLLRFLIFLRLH
jgi:hypothetical protein